MGIEMQNEATEIELLATYELGLMIGKKQAEGELARPKDGAKFRDQDLVPNENEIPTTLPEIGISRKLNSTILIPWSQNNSFKNIHRGLKIMCATAHMKQVSEHLTSGDFKMIPIYKKRSNLCLGILFEFHLIGDKAHPQFYHPSNSSFDAVPQSVFFADNQDGY